MKPYDLLAYQQQAETLIAIQDVAIKYRGLATSGKFDAKTSRRLLELADMVEKKAKELDAAGKY